MTRTPPRSTLFPYTTLFRSSGATVTVVVMGEGIMRSARQVARGLGILEGGVAEPATVREDVFEEASWETLLEEGAVGHLHLTRGQVDEAFIGTDAEGVDTAPEGREDETFIDLYFAYLNVPTVGRNLLGERQFEQLMEGLAEGEHALAIMANGRYSFKGSGFVRGGIYDRILVHHGGRSDQFTDSDMRRRSEEHTSELQSRPQLVCRLLLEKKKA